MDKTTDQRYMRLGMLTCKYIFTYRFKCLCNNKSSQERTCNRTWERYNTAHSSYKEGVLKWILHRQCHSTMDGSRCGTVSNLTTYIGTSLHRYIFKYKNGTREL